MPGKFEVVAGPYQSREMPTLVRGRGRSLAEWAEPPSPCECLGRGECLIPVGRQCLRDRTRHTGRIERLCKATVSVTTPRQRTRPCLREFGIVDVAGRHEFGRNGIHPRRFVTVPSTGDDLALQIGFQPRFRRRKAPDIVKRKGFEGRRIERPYRAGRPGLRQSAVFLPQSNRNENAAFQYQQTKSQPEP